jgi:hypothetical protein
VPILRIRYEQLVNEPRATLAAVLRFVQLLPPTQPAGGAGGASDGAEKAGEAGEADVLAAATAAAAAVVEHCVNFHRESRPVPTASLDQVRMPIYNTSVGRWRRYAAWLPELEALDSYERSGQA